MSGSTTGAVAFTVPPAASEFGSYYTDYVAKVPAGDVRTTLREQRTELRACLHPVSAERSLFRYAEGKWSVRELVGHLIDAERVFSFRLFHFARGGGGEIPGMEQDPWVEEARFDERSWEGLREEAWALRTANLAALDEFSPEWLDRGGTASGAHVTVRGLLWILAGHERHHLDVLRQRYLQS